MRRRLVLGVVAVATLASLVGCTPAPTPLVTDVTWVDGAPDDVLESETAVEAVRRFETVAGAAWNVGDYTNDAVTEAMDADTARVLARMLRDELESAEARPVLGPRPLSPLEVTETDDPDELFVVACVDRQLVDEPTLGAFSSGRHYRVRTDRAVAYVVATGAQSDADCEGVAPPIALYAPAPDAEAFAALRADDVRSP